MPSPNLRFYAVCLHNFAAACLVRQAAKAALTEDLSADDYKGYVTEMCEALSAILDNARPLFADAVKAGFVAMEALPAELADITEGVRSLPPPAAGCPDLLVKEIAMELAALRAHITEEGAEARADLVPSLAEAQAVLDSIAKRAGA